LVGTLSNLKDEMKLFTRILLVLLAAQGLSILPAQAQDSSAVAVNTRDGSSVFRLSFSVKRVMDTSVDADNAAVAYASCTDCQTVAASIQVVLVMDDSSSLTTDNVAIAINYQCSECETLAAAYQYVFGDGEPVRFTAEGNQRLADIRRRFQELRRREGLTLQQLAVEIAKLAAEVADVVDKELVPTGQAGAPGQQATSTTTVPATSTSTTTEATSTTTSSIASTTTSTSAPSTTTTTTTVASSTTTTAG
jgi:putative peptide zinc metalloprotease protein